MITENPILCSGIYTGIFFIFSLFSGAPFLSIIIGTVICFALSSLYFHLLDRYAESMLAFWSILIGGLFTGLI
jgi:hypothetical protein